MEIEEIKINSVNDISTCINLASSLELAGWPKPGNVHRTKNFINTRYEHFLSGIAAVQPLFMNFCNKIFNETQNKEQNFSFVELGKFFKKAANIMMTWQSLKRFLAVVVTKMRNNTQNFLMIKLMHYKSDNNLQSSK